MNVFFFLIKNVFGHGPQTSVYIDEDIDNHSMLKSTSCIYFNLPKQKNSLNELGI
jgi:hypothetical protein